MHTHFFLSVFSCLFQSVGQWVTFFLTLLSLLPSNIVLPPLGNISLVDSWLGSRVCVVSDGQ